MDIVWILCFILTVIQTVYCSFCPLVNDVVNITRTIDPSKTFIIWNKNGNPVAIAEYNSSSGQCKGPSTAPNYTKHCASGGVYTLEIHNPVNGDLYETEPTTQNQTIFVQDPVKVDVTVTHPPGNTILLQSKSEILPISCTVGCTTPKPYIQWMYQKENETQNIFMRNMTSPTSCSSDKWSLTDNLTLSDIVNIKGVPIKVFCQVQYSDCDIVGVSSASTDDFLSFTAVVVEVNGPDGLKVWVIVIIVIAVIGVAAAGTAVIVVIVKKIKGKKDGVENTTNM